MRTKEMPTRELRRRGFRVLAEELGPVGFIRFLQDSQAGRGDYTKERARRLSGVTFDHVAKRLTARRRGKPSGK
jgi:hypothetical protein